MAVLCFNLAMMPHVKQKTWKAHIGSSEKKLEMGHWPRGHTVDKRQIYSTADLSKAQTAPGPALPEEHRMEIIRMATKH